MTLYRNLPPLPLPLHSYLHTYIHTNLVEPQSFRVRLIEQLQRGLPVVIDLSDCLCVQQRVHQLDLLQINRVLVCEMDKHVASLEKEEKKTQILLLHVV